MKVTRAATAAVALIALSSGCASDNSSGAEERVPAGASGATADDPMAYALDIMRRTSSARYQPFKSPAAMLDGVDAVVAGEVASVEPALEAGEGEPLGRVMVGVTVKEDWKSPSTAADDVFYYSFARPKNLDFDIYRKGLPIGTEVVVFANEYPVKWAEGDPDSPVYMPFPHGLFVEVDGQLENVYAPGDQGWPAASDTEASLEEATLSGS